MTSIWVEHEVDLHAIGDLVRDCIDELRGVVLIVADLAVAPLCSAGERYLVFDCFLVGNSDLKIMGIRKGQLLAVQVVVSILLLLVGTIDIQRRWDGPGDDATDSHGGECVIILFKVS